MKRTILTLWALGAMASISSAQGTVDWNAADPVRQLHQRLAEQAPSAALAVAGAPVKDGSDGYPHKIDDRKAGKIVEKAGFYNGLHNGYYVFGVEGKRGEIVGSRELSLSEKHEAVANYFARWPDALRDSEQVTRKVAIESRNERIECSALIQYSRNSPQSPQVLANVSLYKCVSEQGKPRPDFHFTYTRLEVSRIMRGVE